MFWIIKVVLIITGWYLLTYFFICFVLICHWCYNIILQLYWGKGGGANFADMQ